MWKGYNTKIKTFEPIEKRSTFKGILQGLKNDEILLQIEQGTIGLHLDWIKEASLSLSFDEMLKENTLNKTNHLMKIN